MYVFVLLCCFLCMVPYLHGIFMSHASHTLIRKDISGNRLTYSINNINRVDKFPITPYPIFKKEQNTILLYIKIKRHLKTVAYQVAHKHRYNFTAIIFFMYNFIINLINILLSAIKFSNGNIYLKLITVNEKLYTILI